MDKVLSIIIPTYNMEKYLDKCLTSLIVEDKNLMKQLEVLVVIDGSKDRSSEIAHAYQDKYPCTFIVIDKENGNYGSCINRGLKEARGKYIKILDADDSFDNVGFEKYLRHILRITSNVDVIFSGYKVVDNDGQVTSEYTRDLLPDKLLNWEVIRESCVRGRHVAMHEIAYRTSMLKEMNYIQMEGISYTDQEWIYYPMSCAKTFYLIDEYVYMYLVGRAGQTMDSSVIRKGVGANIAIAKRMITSYTDMIKDADMARDYLRNNLLWLLNHIYSICLLSSKDDLELDKLIELDAFLLDKIPDLHNSVSDFKTQVFRKVDFGYAQKWQGSKNKNTIPFSIKCLMILKGLISNSKL